eukprot:SAG22_NODE_136_length_18095_cov_19.897255_12_plen_165_part_00
MVTDIWKRFESRPALHCAAAATAAGCLCTTTAGLQPLAPPPPPLPSAAVAASAARPGAARCPSRHPEAAILKGQYGRDERAGGGKIRLDRRIFAGMDAEEVKAALRAARAAGVLRRQAARCVIADIAAQSLSRSRGRLYESSAGAREAVGWCRSASDRFSTATS